MLETDLYTEGATVVLAIPLAPPAKEVLVVAQHGKAAMVDKEPTPAVVPLLEAGVAVLLALLVPASQEVLLVLALGEATAALLVHLVLVLAAVLQPLSLREIPGSMAAAAKAEAQYPAKTLVALEAPTICIIAPI
jgi:hypothetical protein